MKFAIGTALLSALLCTPGQAQDTEVGPVLICDTQQQAERVGILLSGDAQNAVSAISEVNTEENSQTACGVVNVVYVRGAKLTTVRTRGETFEIAPVLVIGIPREAGGVQSVPANVYFSVFKIDERAA
jgi:hypothetical protein